MPTATPGPETPAAVKATHGYDASPGEVFDAWLMPDHARLFLFATPEGEMLKAEIDPRVGGQFCLVERRGGQEVEHVGTYRELSRPLRLVFEFALPQVSPEMSRVSVDIVPQGTGCEIFLTHDNVPPADVQRTQAGWEMILQNLEQVIRRDHEEEAGEAGTQGA